MKQHGDEVASGQRFEFGKNRAHLIKILKQPRVLHAKSLHSFWAVKWVWGYVEY